MATALSAFAKYVRLEVPGCPEPLIEDAILRTCIDFCTRSELLSEIIEITTQETVADYTVATSDPTLYYPARIRNALKDGLPLDPTDAARHAVSSTRAQSGSPERFHAPTRAQVRFDPIPSAAETIELDVVLRPARTATTVPNVLFDEWLDAISNGAKADLMKKPGLPWSNPDLALHYEGRYDTDVGTAGVQVAQGNTGAAMHVGPTPI